MKPATVKTAQSADEWITVLVTRDQKAALEARARAAGVSVAELVRWSVEAFNLDDADNLAQLAAFAAGLDRCNRDASEALDRAPASLAATSAQLDRHAATA